jgi:hypothetical protein
VLLRYWQYTDSVVTVLALKPALLQRYWQYTGTLVTVLALTPTVLLQYWQYTDSVGTVLAVHRLWWYGNGGTPAQLLR